MISELLIAAFILGIVLTIVLSRMGKSDEIARWRYLAYKACSIYLLISIGLKGGAKVGEKGLLAIIDTGLLSIILSMVVFLIAYLLLTRFTKLSKQTRISWASHQGSVSVGTYAAALAIFAQMGVVVNPLSAAWLVLMEVPAIIIGLIFLSSGSNESGGFKKLLFDRSILIMTGMLVVGYFFGPQTQNYWLPIFDGNVFYIILGFFLFEMGRKAGKYIKQLGQDSLPIIGFGIGFPLLFGSLGLAVSALFGLPVEDIAMLGVLFASASYVLATAVMESVCEEKAAVALSLTASLGVTLPFNLIVGIRLYHWVATQLTASTEASSLIAWGMIAVVALVTLVALIPTNLFHAKGGGLKANASGD